MNSRARFASYLYSMTQSTIRLSHKIRFFWTNEVIAHVLAESYRCAMHRELAVGTEKLRQSSARNHFQNDQHHVRVNASWFYVHGITSYDLLKWICIGDKKQFSLIHKQKQLNDRCLFIDAAISRFGHSMAINLISVCLLFHRIKPILSITFYGVTHRDTPESLLIWIANYVNKYQSLDMFVYATRRCNQYACTLY